MIVRADDLRPEGLPVDLRLDVGPLSYVEGFEIQVGATKLAARLRPSRGGLACAGRVEAVVSVPCSRCLAFYTLPVDREFDVSYLPARSAGEAESVWLRFPVRPPRPGVHALALHLRYAVTGAADPASQRACLLLTLGARADPPIRVRSRSSWRCFRTPSALATVRDASSSSPCRWP